MKKIDIIINVSKFLVQHKDYYYQSNGIIFLNGNEIKKLDDNFFGEFYLNNDNLIIQSFYGSFLYKGYQLEGYYNYLNNNTIEYINKQDGYLYIEHNNEFVKTSLKNNAYYIYQHYTIAENIITAYESILPTTILSWQYDLMTKYNWKQDADYVGEPPVEKQAEVIKLLGVYKKELWLVLNSGALLALNLETGEESRYVKNGKMRKGESDFESFKGYFAYDTVLDESNGLIFNLIKHFYIEFDINSTNDYFDSYNFKMSSDKHELNLNYIGGYETDSIFAYEGSDNNRFAIFSREEKEIIWSGEIEDVKDKFPAIRDMKYGNGKIYVLDNKHSLHIFEKE